MISILWIMVGYAAHFGAWQSAGFVSFNPTEINCIVPSIWRRSKIVSLSHLPSSDLPQFHGWVYLLGIHRRRARQDTPRSTRSANERSPVANKRCRFTRMGSDARVWVNGERLLRAIAATSALRRERLSWRRNLRSESTRCWRNFSAPTRLRSFLSLFELKAQLSCRP